MHTVTFLLFGLFALIQGKRPVFNEELEDLIEMLRSECISSTGVAEETINDCENGVFKDDPKLKCYMYCLLETGNLIEEDGSVNYEILFSMLPPPYDATMEAGVNACKQHDRLDVENCQRAFNVHKCVYAADPEHYILF